MFRAVLHAAFQDRRVLTSVAIVGVGVSPLAIGLTAGNTTLIVVGSLIVLLGVLGLGYFLYGVINDTSNSLIISREEITCTYFIDSHSLRISVPFFVSYGEYILNGKCVVQFIKHLGAQPLDLPDFHEIGRKAQFFVTDLGIEETSTQAVVSLQFTLSNSIKRAVTKRVPVEFV